MQDQETGLPPKHRCVLRWGGGEIGAGVRGEIKGPYRKFFKKLVNKNAIKL